MRPGQLQLFAALSVGLCIVAALALWDEVPKEAIEEGTVLIWELPESALTEIEYQKGDEHVSLLFSNNQWMQNGKRADDAQVDALVQAIRHIRRGLLVELPEPKLEEFSLDAAERVSLRVKFQNGEEKRLFIGRQAMGNARTYVQHADGPVVAASARLVSVFSEGESAYIDHRFFHFDASDVRRVQIVRQGRVLAVEGQGHDWLIDGFHRARADSVENLVVSIQALRFDLVGEFSEEIADPEFVIDVELKGGEHLVSEVGENTPMGRVAVVPDGRSGLVAPVLLTFLQQDVPALGIKKAFGVDRLKADTVDFIEGNKRFVANRNGSAWEAGGLADGEAWDAVSALAAVGVVYRPEPARQFEGGWASLTLKRGDMVVHYDVGQQIDEDYLVIERNFGAPYRVSKSQVDTFRREAGLLK